MNLCCGVTNTEFLAFNMGPRKNNPFETTVRTFDPGEMTCGRSKGHSDVNPHGYADGKNYCTFRNP